MAPVRAVLIDSVRVTIPVIPQHGPRDHPRDTLIMFAEAPSGAAALAVEDSAEAALPVDSMAAVVHFTAEAAADFTAEEVGEATGVSDHAVHAESFPARDDRLLSAFVLLFPAFAEFLSLI
jgi:hypothetical protein